MPQAQMQTTVERLAQKVGELVAELEDHRRPPVVTHWALRVIATRMDMKVVVIDPVVEPLAHVRDLVEQAESELMRAIEEDETDDQELKDTVLDAAIKLLSWAPAANGWNLKFAESLKARRHAHTGR